jgi:hypothetical protein
MAFDGRLEKRIRIAVSVYLASAREPRSGEKTLTENVSLRGTRVAGACTYEDLETDIGWGQGAGSGHSPRGAAGNLLQNDTGNPLAGGQSIPDFRRPASSVKGRARSCTAATRKPKR